MRDALKQHFSEEALRASGLFSAKEQADGSPGPMYARFRKRITFPIANEAGKMIAFTARALETRMTKGREVAKYLNSPETALYTKGNVLFNLDKAKGEMRKSDFALLVEGQMDCISVYMARDSQCAWRLPGTAFTEQQVRLLGRFTKRVIVNFDPDTAGATAAEKSIALLTEEDFDIKVVSLEGGLDPDRFVREQGIAGVRRGAARGEALLGLPDRPRAAAVSGADGGGEGEAAELSAAAYPADAECACSATSLWTTRRRSWGSTLRCCGRRLKQAAAQRMASIPAHRAEPVTETERILLRALVLPETDSARGRGVDEPGGASGVDCRSCDGGPAGCAGARAGAGESAGCGIDRRVARAPCGAL